VFGFGKKEIGQVPVPGEGKLTLPAGKVELRYVEEREGRQVSEGRTWPGPGKDLEVTVTSTAGEPLEIKKPLMIQEGSGRTIHKKLGTVVVPADGDYVVSASMTLGESHSSPRIVARA
jgi:hypothetical protein